jgi:hypothetical protein
MSHAENEIRSALRLLEPRLAEFEARLREAAASCPRGHPFLQSLRDNLHLLTQERQRLRTQLEQFRA